ncbi:hypothetical protein HGP28_11790 [Vibrio sp. SM6]|uniref:Uncharacterized protein n=1 Tax=Vibrio agarilyticus TaxID=2726741 RepID=A0A7X8TRR0_9VIBR|nr:hypothetical protein [Vibrio agarilyticus]NLS13574.1 hypothetical protein [Vibrio agarilyticus]
MRVSPNKRRRWNNYLILIVIAAMALFNAPTWIKAYLMPQETQPSTPELTRLFTPDEPLRQLETRGKGFIYLNGTWRFIDSHATEQSGITAATYLERWLALTGTVIDSSMVEKIIMSAEDASQSQSEHLTIWYQGDSEPQRLTYYVLPRFWLMKNAQGQWMAVTVPDGYLLPATP